MQLKSLVKFALPVLMAFSAAAPAQVAEPSAKLLTPKNHTLIMIDHQPQMAFATRSIDIAELRNNVTGLAKAASVFKVPTILTTVGASELSREQIRQAIQHMVAPRK